MVINHDGSELYPNVRELARAALNAVLAGDRKPVAVAHPLEFVCVPILRTPGFGVCGHIWKGASSAPTIHCHSWHLRSYVIAGAVVNESFVVTERPGADLHLLNVDSVGLLDRITPAGKNVMVQLKERTLYETGSSYSMRAGVFHRSTPTSAGTTLTLLSATALPGGRDQLIADHIKEQTTQRAELPASVARTLVALLINAIDPYPLRPAHERVGTPRRRFHGRGPKHRAGRI